MSYHRPSRSHVPSSWNDPTTRPTSTDTRGLTTERRSQALSRLYEAIRDSLPALPPYSALQSEDQLLAVVKDAMTEAAVRNTEREVSARLRERELDKQVKRVELKQQQLDSKLREVEMERTRLLNVQREIAGRQSEFEEFENRAELRPFEWNLELQLAAEARHRLRIAQDEVPTRGRDVQQEIKQLQADKLEYSNNLRIYTQHKLALEAAEAQIIKDQETASRQLALVDAKLAELTSIQERQERKLKAREEEVRARENEVARREGQVRDAQRKAQDQRTAAELQLAELRKRVLTLEAEAEAKAQADSREGLVKAKEEAKSRTAEAMEHLRIKERELAQREKVLSALAASLAEEQRCLQQEKLELADVPRLSAGLSLDQVGMLREDLGSHAHRLEDYAQWLVTREAELESWQVSVQEDKDCIENSALMLDELQAEIEQQRVELEDDRAKVKADSQRLAADMKKLKTAAKSVEHGTRQLKSKEQQLAHSEEMLTERKLSLDLFEKALNLRALQEEHRTDELTPCDIQTPRSSVESAALFT